MLSEISLQSRTHIQQTSLIIQTYAMHQPYAHMNEYDTFRRRMCMDLRPPYGVREC